MKHQEVHKVVEDSLQPSICNQKFPKSNQIHNMFRDSKFEDLALDDVFVAPLISMRLTTKYTNTKQLKPLPVVMEPSVSFIMPLPKFVLIPSCRFPVGSSSCPHNHPSTLNKVVDFQVHFKSLSPTQSV